MPRVDVAVHATVGSRIGQGRLCPRAAELRANESRGWPVGWGRIHRTRGRDGSQIEALALMAEPALAGVDIRAWTIGLLDLGEPSQRQILLCVAEEEPFLDLIDIAIDGDTWHADTEQWCETLQRLDSADPVFSPSRCLGNDAAEYVLSTARRRYVETRDAVPARPDREPQRVSGERATARSGGVPH